MDSALRPFVAHRFGLLLPAAVASLVASWLHLPLPWMIGPLLLVGGLRIRGIALEAPPGSRQAGQWVIGATLGLYFTPAVIGELQRNASLILAIAACSLPFGMICSELVRRLTGCDRATAYFASLPGGASEMAVLAERHGGAVDLIAAAHALRVAVVVATIPLILAAAGAHGSDAYAPLARELDWQRMPLLVAASLAGALALRTVGVANAWVLGPLFAVGLVTATGTPLSAMPTWLVNGGQLLIGIALGSRFSPDFFERAPRFMAAALASTLAALLLGASLALLFAMSSSGTAATLLLAAAPGGIAEMSVTARDLQLGVPLVTACHVLRVVVLSLGAGPCFRLFRLGPRRQRC
ncbi:MAG: AbrB family transcriptional regulator [Rhodocyclaceae bacterium]|nr:AbrB family transcriptional regulator [Rhodocyclaceae bacterium]